MILLPELAVRLKAARQFSTEPDLRWSAQVGVGAGLFRLRGVTGRLSADMETGVGETSENFDARQTNYDLELGARRGFGRSEGTVFLHHVSRHDLDRPKEQAVDWNVLGVRVSARLTGGPAPARITLGVGHTTQVSFVRYRWEISGEAETNLFTGRWGSAYLVSNARFVTTKPSQGSPRKRFLDLSVALGASVERLGRSFGAFVAFERRNDVFLEAPGSRNRGVLGLQFGYSDVAPSLFP